MENKNIKIFDGDEYINVIKNGNITKHYLKSDGRLLLTITEDDNNYFTIENEFNKLSGICKNLDEYKTLVKLEKNMEKNKEGIFKNTRKLLRHNTSWFSYILQEYGYVYKTKSLC